MHACYVIDNKQSEYYSTYGTIYCWYYLTITDSYINNNVASRDFYCDYGTITVKNCVVNMSKEKYGTVTYDVACKESGEIIDGEYANAIYVIDDSVTSTDKTTYKDNGRNFIVITRTS